MFDSKLTDKKQIGQLIDKGKKVINIIMLLLRSDGGLIRNFC